jgi:SAM-dependent methyltransferase
MDFAGLAGLAGGHAEARAIQVALKLGMFEVLANGPRDDGALAAALGCDRRATALLANAIAALGLLDKLDGRFALSATSRRHLLRASDEYLGGMILFDEALFSTWGRLEDSIRTGRPARAPDMFQSAPDDTERFIRAMDSLVRARGDASWVAANLELAGVRTIADVGGGPGTYLAALLRRWTGLRAAIYDLPATLAVARRIIAERASDVAARIDLVSADYLGGELPGPVDALFMSNIIHSEDEATNAELMRKCFRALAHGGTIIVKDHIMNRDLTQPPAGAVFSLYLLLTTRGRDYAFDEVAGWLDSAGFRDVRRQDLPSPPFTSSLVVAHKP